MHTFLELQICSSDCHLCWPYNCLCSTAANVPLYVCQKMYMWNIRPIIRYGNMYSDHASNREVYNFSHDVWSARVIVSSQCFLWYLILLFLFWYYANNLIQRELKAFNLRTIIILLIIFWWKACSRDMKEIVEKFKVLDLVFHKGKFISSLINPSLNFLLQREGGKRWRTF